MLLDTNVLIYASDAKSSHCRWARRMIAEGVSGAGVAINAVSLAEVCVGDAEPQTVADRIRSWGVAVLDVPAAASEVCARAYLSYRVRRKADGALSGEAGGYRPIDNAIAILHVGGVGVASVAGVECASIRKTLRILADGDRDPKSGQCTTVSSGMNFNAKPAFVFDKGRLINDKQI